MSRPEKGRQQGDRAPKATGALAAPLGCWMAASAVDPGGWPPGERQGWKAKVACTAACAVGAPACTVIEKGTCLVCDWPGRQAAAIRVPDTVDPLPALASWAVTVKLQT